jgi:aminoglycoside phosphotransferase (APT) family kinase protein
MNINITPKLVSCLIALQFPQYNELHIEAVKVSGIDNKTFHLGDDLLIRLPSAEGYAAQVKKEQQWLPKLAESISIKIPKLIGMGVPNEYYPWNWSIYNWIEGASANLIELDDLTQEQIAIDLAKFIRELHNFDTKNAPAGGLHPTFRTKFG